MELSKSQFLKIKELANSLNFEQCFDHMMIDMEEVSDLSLMEAIKYHRAGEMEGLNQAGKALMAQMSGKDGYNAVVQYLRQRGVFKAEPNDAAYNTNGFDFSITNDTKKTRRDKVMEDRKPPKHNKPDLSDPMIASILNPVKELEPAPDPIPEPAFVNPPVDPKYQEVKQRRNESVSNPEHLELLNKLKESRAVRDRKNKEAQRFGKKQRPIVEDIRIAADAIRERYKNEGRNGKRDDKGRWVGQDFVPYAINSNSIDCIYAGLSLEEIEIIKMDEDQTIATVLKQDGFSDQPLNYNNAGIE